MTQHKRVIKAMAIPIVLAAVVATFTVHRLVETRSQASTKQFAANSSLPESFLEGIKIRGNRNASMRLE